MMCIKKLLSLLAVMSISLGCVAQIKWDIKAGLNYSNVMAKDQDGNSANTSTIPGIYLGVGTTIPLSNQFAVHPMLVFAKRGFKQEESSHIGRGNNFETKVSYIELPVDLLYSPKIGPGNLLLGAGPYIGYGTSGKWTTSSPVLIGDILIDGKGDISFQNDKSYAADMSTYVYAKPWDFGVHLSIGYSLFNHYSLSFDIQHGIADLQPDWAEYKSKNTVRNKSFGVSLNYRF